MTGITVLYLGCAVAALGQLLPAQPTGGAAQTSSPADAEVREVIEALVAAMTPTAGLPRYQQAGEAQQRLLELPRDAVVPQIVQALQGGSESAPPTVRYYLFNILVRHEAEKLKIGQEVLLACLTDEAPPSRLTCAQALSRSTDDVRAVAFHKLAERFDFPPHQWPESPEALRSYVWDLTAVVEAMAYFGSAGKAHLESMEAIFRSEKLVELSATASEPEAQESARAAKRLREEALGAIYQIGRIDRVLQHVDGLDPVGRTIILGGLLAGVGARTAGQFDGNAEHQKAVRQFVVDSFSAESRDVREAALDALIFVYGDDAVLVHTPTDYELNPEMERLLREMASHDLDPQLRERATSALGQIRGRLDRAAKKILEKRGGAIE